jgi:zinc protease
MSGSGEEDVVKNIALDDVRGFYQRWVRPNNATIVVTGDITMAELTARLEKQFAGWQKGETPKKVIPEVKTANNGKLFLIDRPESPQSMIVAGYLAQKYGELDETAIEQMNNVLGGDFTSRINMNIREDKHWSYGARSMMQNTRGQRPYLVYAPVQTDKTKESVQEIVKELNAFVGDKPLTQAEFDKTKQNSSMGMAGMWETNAAVNASARTIVKYGLADDYWKTYSDRLSKLSLQDLQKVAKSIVQPNNVGWFMAADAQKVLPGLKELGVEIIQIDANGQPIAKKAKP